MKKFKNFIAVFLTIVLSLFVLSGCAVDSKVKSASKNLSTYNIDAVFCDSEKKITAVENVNYINNTKFTLNEVSFNLYGRAFSDRAKVKPYSKVKIEECFPNGINYGDMTINSCRVEGQDCEINYIGEDDNALEVKLNESLAPGEDVNITLEFELYLANCTHRLGFNDGKVNLGNWYPIVAVYENDGFNTSPYYANGDPFYSDCANYNVKISYDDAYKLISTGNLDAEVEESGVKQSTYSALAVRDFAMVLLLDYTEVGVEIGNTMVTVVAKNGDDSIGTYLETAKRSLELFNNLFGEYPYRTLNIVFTDFFQGGMEYPNLVYISNAVTELTEIKKVIVHEIAHQWWYGLVGNNEVNTAWFDEGLAEYSTLLYFENYPDEGIDAKKMVADTKVSYELYLDVIKTLNLEINYSMELGLNEYLSEYEYVYMVYVKGLLFFDGLRLTLGDEIFFKCLQNIFKDFEFKNINKELFIASIEKTSGLDLTEFVEGWLSGKVDIS